MLKRFPTKEDIDKTLRMIWSFERKRGQSEFTLSLKLGIALFGSYFLTGEDPESLDLISELEILR